MALTTTFPSEPIYVCSRCHKTRQYCECENYHPPVLVVSPPLNSKIINMGTGLWLSLNEAKALYDILEREYIHPEKELAHKVVNKIQQCIKEQE